jgi:glycosyltransferase involved in cell wall biosynthesis
VVVARSDHERERLVRSLGIAPDKIARVLNGAPQPPTTDAIDVAGVRRALGLPEEFVLHISAYTQERKNILRLVEALEPLDLPLVIAGTALPGSILERLEQRVAAGARVRLLGFVDEATKAALYAACKVFCLPSIHEGTGLVAVEAASHGARIVITRNGGPPDYFGAHAEYVDPFDVGDIRRAIERAWRRPDDGGALRRHIVQHLTWDASAAELERVYVDGLQRVRGARLDNPMPATP